MFSYSSTSCSTYLAWVLISLKEPHPNNFDTDGDGTVDQTDEFVELFNTTGSDVDISGWTLTRGASTFTFPAGTMIPAGGYVILVRNYTGTPPTNVFSSGNTFALTNAGGLITLDDGAGNTISAEYNGFGGGDDNFGNDTDGLSIQRNPDGSDTFVSTTPTPVAANLCFLTGTRILTEKGHVPVEKLAIGDLVKTADGKLEAIKWIGYQTRHPNQIGNSLRGYQILVKAGALGKNIPSCDLYLSPDHALLVDELLINAGALVNDISILKTEPTDTGIIHRPKH